MPIVSTRDHARLHVDIAGEGRNVVLISGLGGTAGFWTPLVDALTGNYRTIRFDQRGIAASERGSLPVTVPVLAGDVWEIVDAVGIGKPILWGHSTGGAIVQEMALMRPGEAAGLVLSGTWAGPDWFLERMFRHRLQVLATAPEQYAELSALLATPPRWLRDHPKVLRNSIRNAPDASQIEIVKERIHALLAHDCRERIGNIETSALVLGAEDDMIVPPYLQEEVASLLRDARLSLFDRGGHFFPVTRPVETAALFRDWVKQFEVG